MSAHVDFVAREPIFPIRVSYRNRRHTPNLFMSLHPHLLRQEVRYRAKMSWSRAQTARYS